MKTDSLFYQIFLRFPDSFFDLIGQPRQQAANYQFTSQEVKQLSFRLDGLFIPLREDSQQPLYLVEVQFQPDDTLYYRLFAELFLFLKQYRPPHPWQIVVIYPHRRVEREQSLHFGEILNLASVRRIHLDELPHNPSLGIGVIKLVVESETEAVRTAQTLIERTREEITDQSSQRQLINLIESIIIYKLPQKSREEIEAMFELSDLKQTRVYQEALAEGEEQGLERGLEQGLERGLERGLEQGERLVVENLLRVRFGELEPPLQAIISRILQLSPEEFTPLLLHCSKQELLKRFGVLRE